MTHAATWHTHGYTPRVTRLRRGLWLVPVLLLMGGITASILYLRAKRDQPVVAKQDTSTWPSWMKQNVVYPPEQTPSAVPAPQQPDPLLEQLQLMQQELDAQRRAIDALTKRPPPAALKPAAGPKRQHAPMLYMAHEPPKAKEGLPETYTLAPGATKIQCQMEKEMHSEVPGVFTAKVTTHVYDTETGKYLLIPQGSTILGEYNSGNLLYGNTRIPTWSLSATLPDGRTVEVGHAPVTDHVGLMGLTGDVDHHFWRNLAAVLIAGTLRGGAQAVQTSMAQSGPAGQVGVGMASTTSAYGQQAAGRAIDVRPTIRVHAGQPCTVILTKPLHLHAYRTLSGAAWR